MFNSYNNSPSFVQQFVDTTIKHEGEEYTNLANDSGGETKYGVTKKSAERGKEYWHLYNWNGNMKTLPLKFAQDWYVFDYYLSPKFNLVADKSLMLAKECMDSGVNCGQGTASKWLQQLLNVNNGQQKWYNDLVVDGNIGSKTIIALEGYLSKRGKVGEKVLHNMLNTLQGAYYIGLATNKETQEDYLYGWFSQRVDWED